MGVQMQSKSKLQSVCHWMAIIDMFLYFGFLLGSVVVEIVISDLRPMRIQFGDNGTVTVNYAEKDELAAVWDYLYTTHYTSSVIYNVVYMTLVLVAVSYLIIEVWLSCVLIRGATEGSVAHCKKWFWWRLSILLLTVIVAASDLYQMQYTLTLLLLIPLNIYRMTLIVLVLQLIAQLNGSAKMKNFV